MEQSSRKTTPYMIVVFMLHMLLISAVPLLFIVVALAHDLRWIAAGVAAAYLLLLAVMATKMYLWRSFEITWHFRDRRGVDISHENRPPPQALTAAIHTLHELGFQRMGELFVPIQVKGDQNVEWVFVDEERTTTATLVNLVETEELPLMAQFLSAFPDRFFMETTYPVGERMDLSMGRSMGISSSLESAYRFHLRQLNELSAEHGAPLPYTDMQAVQTHEEVYRQGPGWEANRRVYQRLLLIAASFAGATAAGVSLLLTMISLQNAPAPGAATLVGLAVVSLVISGIGVYRAAPRGTDIHQKKKAEVD